jgi:uncharacterized protein YbaA (DUF1428 family)
MSEPNIMEIVQQNIGEVDQFIHRVPKKNHDAMLKLDKQFSDIITKEFGVAHLVFQLSSTEAPMEGISNIAKIISAIQDEEVWLELLFYRDRKHKDEVSVKMRDDERMGPLWQQSLALLSPGTDFIMGEFSRLKMDK